jgi:hypothetical protein
VTIETLPDLALLELFDIYVHADYRFREEELSAWLTLVHVCRKWRSVVFGSPLRLNLRLHCVARTSVRKTLDVWPPLPISITGDGHESCGVDNIVGLLEHNDRICELDLSLGRDISIWQLEKVFAAMQRPFPALTLLDLRSKEGEMVPVVPASFLGGSAPCLQEIFLFRIPFPGLPTVLLTATHLVSLCLLKIPHSGYISPEAMVTCLSALTRLEALAIGLFTSPQSFPDQKSRGPPSQTRILLPVLVKLELKGVDEYLEDLVAWIDAPLVDYLMITFCQMLIIDAPQLTQFIGRTPKFKTADEARLDSSDGDTCVGLRSQTHFRRLSISCRDSGWHVSLLALSCFPQGLIHTVERLYILGPKIWEPLWEFDVEGSQWLELLRPFTAVKALYLSRIFAPHIAPALEELVGERVPEVLPALQTLYFEEPLVYGTVFGDTVGLFVASREVVGHPVSISQWERGPFE